MKHGPKEKKERSLGERLGLKGDRCNSPKCAVVRKPYPPGVHGQQRLRGKVSEFGRQIKEKQKFKLTYGIHERTLRTLFEKASAKKGSTTEELLMSLEQRLDNVVFRLGFAASRSQARQIVVHGHVLVNGKRSISPGLLLRVNDVVSIRPESQAKKIFGGLKERLKKFEPPVWLVLDKDKLEGKLLSMPRGESVPFEVNLLVESFSK